MVVLSLSNLLYPTATANTAPNPIEIISITESSSTSVEILFNSSIPKKFLSYYVINASVDLPVMEQQNSKTQNVAAIAPKNINKVIKTKATGLITAQIKNLNPKAAYNFSISAKTNKGKMINSAAVEYSPLSNLMDLLSNLPADWGNPKPIQLPTPTPTTAPVAIPAFTLSSTTESRTVNTAATGFTINSTGGAIASFAINATPPGMSFNTTTGALTGTPNTVAAATNYTITATNASGNATQTFTLTVIARVYALGETGPGGGIVFYVSAGTFTQTGAIGTMCTTDCKYLEVAPNTWNGGTSDPKIIWQPAPSFGAIPAPGAALRTIGGGYQNSVTVAQWLGDNSTHANGAARRYTGNGLQDWFLPSQNELNQLCVYFSNAATTAQNIAETWSGDGLCNGNAATGRGGIGGFTAGMYHSSSDLAATIANSYMQNLSTGAIPYIRDVRRSYVNSVRPIRAFG